MACPTRPETRCVPLGKALSRTAKILSFPDVVPASACQLREGHLTRPAFSLPVLRERRSFGAVGKRSRQRSAQLHDRNPQATFAGIAPSHSSGLTAASQTFRKRASTHHDLYLHLLPVRNAPAV